MFGGHGAAPRSAAASTGDLFQDLFNRPFAGVFGDDDDTPLLPGMGPAFPDPFHDIFDRTLANMFGDGFGPDELGAPSAPAANSTVGDIFNDTLAGMLDDGAALSNRTSDGTWSMTRIENGHGVQETRTCRAGNCTTVRREFDGPAAESPAFPSLY